MICMEDAEDIARIGQAIRSLRSDRGWTLEELSRRSGEPVNTISRIERGVNEARVLGLFRIARALGVKLDDLIAEIRIPETVA